MLASRESAGELRLREKASDQCMGVMNDAVSTSYSDRTSVSVLDSAGFQATDEGGMV